MADSIANSPGGPVHVLLSDQIAEHIPGCNMAFKRDRLLAIGGFDRQFRVAGDDVDVCWRMQDRGWTLAFAPTAVVWHHRRNSITRYFRQQIGYAQAEALLAKKWPGKYNCAGHLTWQGRLYGRGVVERLFPQARIYHGVWGSAPFQSVYERAPGLFWSCPLMPEWYFLVVVLWGCALLGFSWPPLIWLSPLAAAALGITVIQALRAGNTATFQPEPRSQRERLSLRLLVTWLHLLQPMARLLGRMQQGLGPWSWKGFIPIIPNPRSRVSGPSAMNRSKPGWHKSSNLCNRRERRWCAVVITIDGISQLLVACLAAFVALPCRGTREWSAAFPSAGLAKSPGCCGRPDWMPFGPCWLCFD